MMSFILDLEDEKLKTMFEKQYPALVQLNEQNEYTIGTPILNIKDEIQNFVRTKCEDIKTTEYLWAFKGLIEHNPINIFSLNYDGTIEIFCEKMESNTPMDLSHIGIKIISIKVQRLTSSNYTDHFIG